MKQWKLLLAATFLVAGPLTILACGDDDNGGGGTDSGIPDGSSSGNPDGSTDGGDGGPNASLPAYVEDQITNHTSNTTQPDPASVWDGLPDDPAFVFPATFF